MNSLTIHYSNILTEKKNKLEKDHKRLNFNDFVDKIFMALIIGGLSFFLSYVSNFTKDFSGSFKELNGTINQLNNKMAIVIERTSFLAKDIERQDKVNTEQTKRINDLLNRVNKKN